MLENVLDKRDDENDFEYHKRLINGKLKDKTLSDYDYAELSPYVYGKQYTADETRKRMYGSAATLEVLESSGIKNITDNDILNEISVKKMELQKERQQFFDQRRELNKILNSEGRRDHLYDMLIQAANNIPKEVGLISTNDSIESVTVSENEAVIVLCDWHYGMVTDNTWNYYDTETCRTRVELLLNEVIKRLKVHQCRRAHIVLLGDAIQGGIHVSSRVASEELVCDQLMHVSEIIAQFVIKVSAHVEGVDVYSTFGNHARTVQNKRDNLHMDNMERIIPWWLQQRIVAEESACGRPLNIIVHMDETYEFLLFDVCGYGFCASHGDLDTVKTSPKLLATLFHKTLGKDISYILLADKHHEESFEELGVEALLCGSLCGTDEYANAKRLYSYPFQLMLIVNPLVGVDARYKIDCNYYLFKDVIDDGARYTI